jgi:hypothetical protein
MIQSILEIKNVRQMSMKEQFSKLPDDILKKEILKLILKDVDVSDEEYKESFKVTYKVIKNKFLLIRKIIQKTIRLII